MLNQLKLLKELKQNFSFYDSVVLTLNLVLNRNEFTIPSRSTKVYLRKDSKDQETFIEIFKDRMYDTKMSFVPETIIDAGANVGFSSLFFKLKYPDASLVALEIEANNVEAIKKNLAGFKYVDIIQKALYHKKACFKIENPFNATNSFVIKEVEQNDDFTIESVTIDEIMSLKNWEYVDILKIDIEGSEKDLFTQNYRTWLPKVKIIFIETHDRMLRGCSSAVTNAINEFEEFILYTTTTGTLVYYNTNLMEIPK